jgi:hypothetical protein
MFERCLNEVLPKLLRCATKLSTFQKQESQSTLEALPRALLPKTQLLPTSSAQQGAWSSGLNNMKPSYAFFAKLSLCQTFSSSCFPHPNHSLHNSTCTIISSTSSNPTPMPPKFKFPWLVLSFFSEQDLRRYGSVTYLLDWAGSLHWVRKQNCANMETAPTPAASFLVVTPFVVFWSHPVDTRNLGSSQL